MADNKRTMLKIVIAGDCQVGKTAIAHRFTGEDVPDAYLATISPKYSVKETKIRGKKVLLQIWDTPGKREFFEYLGNNFFADADCFVLVYDVTNKSSFESLDNWLDEILVHVDARSISAMPVVAVGNKSDLGALHRQVSKQQAYEWCQSKCGQVGRNYLHLETSARSNADVRKTFGAIAKHCLQLEWLAQQPPGTSSSSRTKRDLNLLRCCSCNIC